MCVVRAAGGGDTAALLGNLRSDAGVDLQAGRNLGISVRVRQGIGSCARGKGLICGSASATYVKILRPRT